MAETYFSAPRIDFGEVLSCFRTSAMENIFREALRCLDSKKGVEMSDAERNLIAAAEIPLMVKTESIFPEGITISEGLEMLANMVEKKGG